MPFDQDRNDVAMRCCANDAAHDSATPCIIPVFGFLRGRCHLAIDTCFARATVSCPAGASWTTVLPPPIVAPVADRDRRHQHAVRSDVHVVADDRLVLVRAVVVRRDRPRAEIHAAAEHRVADVGEVVRLRCRRPACSPSPRRSCRYARLQQGLCRGAAARTARCGSCGR